MSTNYQYDKLCDSIFALNTNIRFVGVIDVMGKLIAGGMRHGLNSMEDKSDTSKLYLEFAFRNVLSQDYDNDFGKVIYTMTEREKIKLASFPLDKHVLRVSMEKKEPLHNEIIKNILKLISDIQR